MKLPTKLGKEPLADILFEMRFKSRLPASSLLPGVLFSGLPGENSSERLPVAYLPEQVRNADRNLAYAPVERVHWSDKYTLLIGDRSLAVASKLPYRGWADFKPSIIKVVGLVQGARILEAVERCSIKAIDIVPNTVGQPRDVVISELRIGDYDVLERTFHVRAEIEREGLLHIVQLGSEARATVAGEKRVGVLIDTDTILQLSDAPMDGFVEQLPQLLDKLHDGNKQMFFSFLKEGALKQLDPRYD